MAAGRFDALDQATMLWLRKEADRKRSTVADIIYEALESFVAKCEAQHDLETKIRPLFWRGVWLV
jgi:hypothetical protein